MKKPYVNPNPVHIKPLKEARTELLYMLMQPWLPRERLRRKALENDLRSLDIPRQYKREISDRINDYVFFGGKLFWRVEEIPKLQGLLKAVLGLSTAAFVDCVSLGDANAFRQMIQCRTAGLNADEVDEVCNLLTKGEADHAAP